MNKTFILSYRYFRETLKRPLYIEYFPQRIKMGRKRENTLLRVVIIFNISTNVPDPIHTLFLFYRELQLRVIK